MRRKISSFEFRVSSETSRDQTVGRVTPCAPGSRDQSTARRGLTRPTFNSSAFTLIEIMVVVVLLAVIILGLMAMFSQVQRAFRAGMTQTDVLEGGRTATEIISRELEQIAPSYVSAFDVNGFPRPNFSKYMVSDAGSYQSLVGGTNARTNILDDLFFLVHENQTWTGIGYFVRANITNGTAGAGLVGTLYRYETNCSAAQFAQNPGRLYSGFLQTVLGNNTSNNVSKIMDGVIHFRARAYDTNGVWLITTNLAPNTPYFLRPNIELVSPVIGLSDCKQNLFFSNAVPAYLEFELGVLEQRAYERYQSIPILSAQDAYLRNQASRVHLFRQRIGVRNVDPLAYQ